MDRMIRQSRLIPQGMQEANVMLVGLGMGGSWMAHALTRCVGHVYGWDMDEVGPENVGTQAFGMHHIGMNKADAMVAQLVGLPFTGSHHRWEASLDDSPADLGIMGSGPLIVVSGVDTFEGRRLLARWADRWAQLFIDCRIHGTVSGVITVSPTVSGLSTEEYLKDLTEVQNNAPEPACGMEGTAFVAMWEASQVCNTIRRAMMGMRVPPKVVQDVGFDNRIPQEEAQVTMR